MAIEDGASLASEFRVFATRLLNTFRDSLHLQLDFRMFTLGPLVLGEYMSQVDLQI